VTRPRVVIAGAGFGGLTCARALKHAPVDVVIVDRNNYHLFTPLLYQVASALLDPGEIARPVRSLIRPLANVDFKQAEVIGADLDGRRLLTDRGEIPYDYLVLATGSQSDYFGNASLARHAYGLKDLEEGLALRNRVLSQFEISRWENDAEQRRILLTFAVVGAGPTGVELAGSLVELIHLVLRKDYRDLDLGEVRVLLLEAAAAPLGTFVATLREAARKSLAKKGVEVMLGAKVESVDESSIKLVGGKEIAAGTVIWTAGVRASDLGKTLGIELGRQARIKVEATLQVPGHPAAFVIGDLAGATVDGAPLPMLIPVAMQEGKQVAATISELVRNGGAKAFRYKDPGIMATIGRNSAVAELGAVRLSGFLGWLMWLGVHLVNVISFRSRLIVLVNWAWEYLFYDRPVRLILRAKQGGDIPSQQGGAPGTGSARPGALRGDVPPQEDRASQTGPMRG
jgi:NADH:ubiquinone reductase (H+-translocating)